jgi:hypothetical protein
MIPPEYRMICRESSEQPSCGGGPYIQQHEREDLSMVWSLPSQPFLEVQKLLSEGRALMALEKPSGWGPHSGWLPELVSMGKGTMPAKE